LGIYAALRCMGAILGILSSQVIEIFVLNGLPSFDSLIRIHFEHLGHQINFDFIHHGGIPSLYCFRMRYLGELESLIPRVSVEFLL
jgi:hypothetical protein